MDTVFIGDIALFSFQYQIDGWIPCMGQTLSVMQNQALFALLGARYGGDGRTTFALPNLKYASPLPHMSYYIALEGIFPDRPS